YSGSAMRSSSRSPRSSNRHSSTLVALAEKRAKCVPLPSHAAPQGCGKPSCTTLFLVAFMNLVSLFKFYLALESLRLLLALHNQESVRILVYGGSNITKSLPREMCSGDHLFWRQ